MYNYRLSTGRRPIEPLSVNVIKYKTLRSAGGLRRPLRSLRKEKHVQLREAGRRSMIEYMFFVNVVVANWRLDNAKSHMPYVRTYIPQVGY